MLSRSRKVEIPSNELDGAEDGAEAEELRNKFEEHALLTSSSDDSGCHFDSLDDLSLNQAFVCVVKCGREISIVINRRCHRNIERLVPPKSARDESTCRECHSHDLKLRYR